MVLEESIAIGLVLGFFFYETVGLTAGGFVVPGYIALYLDRPLIVILTLSLGLLTYAIVVLLSRVVILYGRRRFILMILIGYSLQWIVRLAAAKGFFPNFQIEVIGYIIPGLIANEMARQRVVPTLLSLIVVTVMVRLILILLETFRAV